MAVAHEDDLPVLGLALGAQVLNQGRFSSKVVIAVQPITEKEVGEEFLPVVLNAQPDLDPHLEVGPFIVRPEFEASVPNGLPGEPVSDGDSCSLVSGDDHHTILLGFNESSSVTIFGHDDWRYPMKLARASVELAIHDELDFVKVVKARPKRRPDENQPSKESWKSDRKRAMRAN